MAKLAKFLQGVAGAAGGAGLNVEDVFSTYLYEGSGSARNIVNDINMADNGGLVWIKSRTEGGSQYDGFHILCDSERGANKTLNSDSNRQENWTSFGNTVTGFNNTNGFSIGDSGYVNYNGHDFASWTFRKAPKFFDVVTYTGTGNENNTINHNLGSVPGMIIVKRTDSTSEWLVYHRGVNGGTNPEQYNLRLQATDAQDQNSSYFSNTAPTATTFTVGSLNSASGGTYVAYLFAHNDGDGEFGPDGDADIIKCGSYTPDGSGNATIDLGFEPQWLLIKCSSQGGTYRGWGMFDAMRGVPTGSFTSLIEANLSDAEKQWFPNPRFTPTGFETTSADQADTVNTGGQTYIYIAIRRGPMAVPESATDVFSVDYRTSNLPEFKSGFVSDFALRHYRPGADHRVVTRLLGKTNLVTNSTAAEVSYDPDGEMDFMNGWGGNAGASTDIIAHTWKRAPNFFDVVAYTGNGTAGRTVSHNLGVAPEMMWIKKRNTSDDWAVYHSALGNTDNLFLNDPQATASRPYWNNTTPTDASFTLGSHGKVNNTNDTYIAYLFASLDGVSKVGSFSHTVNTATNVDCGFTSGARFVLAKQSDGSGNWWVWDTERGIVAGNDNRLALNTTGAENTSNDDIDPYSAGFTWAATWSTGTYIFYAIA